MYLITFLTFILLLLIFLLVLFAVVPMKIAAIFNSEEQQYVHLTATWLNPFLKVFIARDSNKTLLTVYLFSKKVMTRNLSHKKVSLTKLSERNLADYNNLIKILELNNVKLLASYGFEDPSITGMVCGYLDLISGYIMLEEFYNNADFSIEYSYFNIRTEAEINITLSLANILRRKLSHLRIHVFSHSK